MVEDPSTMENSSKEIQEYSNNEFIREYELEKDQGSLFLIQKEVGDVHCVVWDAALVLSKFLEKFCLDNKDILFGKKIVELGSGLGCVGLVAAFYGADVILTDLPNVLPQLEMNMKKNEKLIQKGKGSAKAMELDWNGEFDLEPCDFILAADCVYYKDSVSGLVNAFNRLSTATTRIFLTQENRSYSKVQSEIWHSFIVEMSKIFKINIVPPREQHEVFKTADIYLLEFTKL